MSESEEPRSDLQQLTARANTVLSLRRRRALLRQLRPPQPTACDFSSNDYLGLSRSRIFHGFLTEYLNQHPAPCATGATGSRLLSGHSPQMTLLEQHAAHFHKAAAALLLNSGYDANLSLLSCLPGPHDAIVYDELVHASIHDGIRMSRAFHNGFPFAHNDLTSLRRTILIALSKHRGSIIVCVETLYSMDGDVTPLKDLLTVCEQLQRLHRREIHVIADEAHSGGLYGPHGEGLAVHLGVHDHPNLLVRLITFGKAFASHGAVILTRHPPIITYLLNYARPLVYSTALPPSSVATLRAVYAFAMTPHATTARDTLWSIIHHFRRAVALRLPARALLASRGDSPIHAIRVHGNGRCVEVAEHLRKRGFDVYPIRSPTVAAGTERIRVILHAHNSTDEIDRFVGAILHALSDGDARPRL